MSFRKKHWVLGASILAASALIAGCGGSDEEEMEPVTPPVTPMPPVTPPVVVPPMSTGSIADIAPTTGLLAFIRANMDEDGNVMQTIEAGMSWTPMGAGVTFMCPAGDADCDVTLSIGDDDSVMGSWERAEDMGDGVTAMFRDPAGEFNSPSVASMAAFIRLGVTAEDDTATTEVNEREVDVYDETETMLGLKDQNHDKGPKTIDDVMMSGPFDPNQASAMLTAGDGEGNNDITDMAGAIGGLDGWDHRVLHADWGDTANGADAGLETLAVIYSNIEDPMMHDFEDAANLLAHATPRGWFTLDANGGIDIVTTDAGANSQAMNIVIDSEDSAVGHTTIRVDTGEQVRGTYFGAEGTFSCSGTGCLATRSTTGDTDFMLADSDDDATNGYGQGTWRFVPDEDAMVMLPDQDWVTYGIWVTAPDNAAAGVHRMGVFHDGMETYDYDATDSGLTGSATYSGSAAGYYVNGTDHGLFTADASLAVVFDDNDANTTDDMLSGVIENFVNSRGEYIDSDNRSDPNDPSDGGEGDWAVVLDPTAINGDGTFAARGTTSGNADGIAWSGSWDAQLYGPGGRVFVPTADRPADGSYIGEAPTGVGGNFSAITADTDSDPTGTYYRGVVGSFGAMLDEHVAPPE